MSTVAQIARDIRKSRSYVTESVAENLYSLGYSRTGRPTLAGILLDLHNHEGDYTPDRVAEYLYSLGYSNGSRMTEDEVRTAFEEGTRRWRDEGRPPETLRRYWAEELGVKIVPGTRIQGGV